MVKITNGVDVFEVTNGAFDGIYSRQGYSVVNDKAEFVSNPNGDPSGEEIKLSEDEIFCADLMEKPIGQWNKEEIKRFCGLKEIDISGTKNAGEAKELIKAFLDSQE